MSGELAASAAANAALPSAPAAAAPTSPRIAAGPTEAHRGGTSPRAVPALGGGGSLTPRQARRGIGGGGTAATTPRGRLTPRSAASAAAAESVPPPPSWLHSWRPLELLQHGALSAKKVLADVRGMVWLVDFSHADVGAHASPFADAAALVSELLFERLPVPYELAELQGCNAAELLERLELSEAAAAKLHRLLESSDHALAAIGSAAAHDEELKAVLPRLADEKICQRRTQEATSLVDALLAGAPAAGAGAGAGANAAPRGRLLASGAASAAEATPAQIWMLSERTAPSELPAYAQQVFGLCTTVLGQACELTAKASQGEGLAAELAKGSLSEEAECHPPDLHMANLLFPLLTCALQRLLSGALGKWQKRVAWHAACAVGSLLRLALPTPPAAPPELGTVARKEVRFVRGQRVALVGDVDSRLGGREGSTRLAQVMASGEDEARHDGRDESLHEGMADSETAAADKKAADAKDSRQGVAGMALWAKAQGAAAPSKRKQMVSSLYGLTSVERRLTWDSYSHAVLPWHPPPPGAAEAVLEDTRQSYEALRELCKLPGTIPTTDGSAVPKGGARSGGGRAERRADSSDEDEDARDDSTAWRAKGGKVTHEVIDSAADRIARELQRLQRASEPLHAPMQATWDAVQQCKAAAVEARAAATRAEAEATAATEEAGAAVEASMQRVATAKAAEEQAEAAEGKAAVARADTETAEVKARDTLAAASKTTAKRGGGINLTTAAAEDASKAAEAARNNAMAAEMVVEQAAQMAESLRATAREAEAVAAEAMAAKDKAIADAAAASTAASVEVIRTSLVDAVTVDRGALEAAVEAWAWQRLRATGGAGQRMYASGQRLAIRLEASGATAAERSAGSTPQAASRAAPSKGARASTAKADGAAASDAGAGAVGASRDVWVDATVLGPAAAQEGGGSAGAPSAGAPCETVGGTAVAPSTTACTRHRLSTADGHEVVLSLHPWNHGPLDLPAGRFEAVRARHARTMRVQHATLVDALSGRRLDVLEQCVPIEIVSAAPGAVAGATGGATSAARPEHPSVKGRWASAAAAVLAPTTSEAVGAAARIDDVSDVASLAGWLQSIHAERCRTASEGTQVSRSA